MRNILVLGMLAVAGSALALGQGAAFTDRFGYTGTVTRYDTLADAQNGTNPVEVIPIGNRDLALYQSQGHPTENDFNIMMGSWWYTTAVDGNGQPRGSGWGNTRGNTGIGFMQLYEAPDDGFGTDTRSALDMYFSGWDGSYMSTFHMNMSGGGSDPYARFSTHSNVGDAGLYHEYQLNMTVTGLQGQWNGALGMYESFNQPTGVSGTYKGIFENTASYPGFYAFHLDLDMTNWAWENRDDLVIDPFADSYFAAVPEPFTMMLGAAGLAVAIRRRRNRK